MQCCRTACCGPGYCHHQLQVLHWIHIYRRWVSFAPRYTPECAMWSQRLLFIFLYCLQKHCADCRGDSHRLHLHSVLWCAAGTSPGKTHQKLFRTHVCYSDSQSCLHVALPVCLLRDSSRMWDAENRRPVQPGGLLLHRSSSGSGSNVCSPPENFR